ncbi:MAG: DUF305 domain-containing protein, partial [Ilumatobacteraceae bacterium]
KQAIEMADIALGSAVNASSSVADLATRIKRAKDPEIKMMQSWLTSWGRSMPTEVDTQQMPAMSGTISGDDMAHLGAARNLDFDTLWLEMMIHHHEGAITMAQQEKVSGSNTDARALADRILATQQTEIDEMKSMVGGD